MIRVRKRVTLMVVTVSVIFGICWGTSSVVYTLRSFEPHDVGPVPIAITKVMVLFNSAVNPFVYALLNQQFRERMKRMLCCTCSSASSVHPTREHQNMELDGTPTRLTQQGDVPRREMTVPFSQAGVK